MTEVLTYATEEQADSDLERIFDRNNEVIGELERRFGDLSEVSKSKEDGEQFEVDCLFHLVKIFGKYAFSAGAKDDERCLTIEHYKTLEELVAEIKKSISSGEIFKRYGTYGINVNHVFYTHTESREFDREKAKSFADKFADNLSDVFARQVREGLENSNLKVEGLSTEEIAEFERLYDAN